MRHASVSPRASAMVLLLAGALVAGPVAAGERTRVEFHPGPHDLPFSEAVRVGDLLFLSGEIGVRPGTLELVEGGIRAEARQTMENIKATLDKRGYAMDDLVKCTVMLADISEWEAFNEVYRTFFEEPYPARSAFAGTGLALGARVEVECIAAGRSGTPDGDD